VLPKPPSWIQGVYFKGKGEGKMKRGEKREGRREWKRDIPPPWLKPRSTTDRHPMSALGNSYKTWAAPD